MTLCVREISDNKIWLDQIFSARSITKGGVVRRSVKDVERKIGSKRLMDEVQRRGFHLIQVGGQYVIICDPGLLRVLC